ncbi:MAG: FAD-binding protein [Alphaproteobacteria bacterium]
MDFDVIIIGGGFAGLTAANRCAEHGMTPLVLEAGAEPFYMCNSRIATGALHVAYNSPEAPADKIHETIMGNSRGTARADLSRAIATWSATAFEWMKTEGALFEDHPRRLDCRRCKGGPAASYVGGLIKSFAIGLIAAETIASARGEPN